MSLAHPSQIFTILCFIACSLNLGAQNNIDFLTRAQASQQSIENAKVWKTLSNDQTENGANYQAGFDEQLFESNLEANGCLEAQQISVNVIDVVNQVGTFTNGISGAGLSIDEGIVLTTGTVAETFTDNNAVLVSLGSSDANAIADPDFDTLDPGGQTTHNESLLIFEFTIPDGLNGLRVPFQFSSDEYPEYVGTQFNDVFGFFISGPGIVGTQNIALVPGTNNAIAVNSINSGSLGTDANVNNYPAQGDVFLFKEIQKIIKL